MCMSVQPDQLSAKILDDVCSVALPAHASIHPHTYVNVYLHNWINSPFPNCLYAILYHRYIEIDIMSH